jgi:hypothetical protein
LLLDRVGELHLLRSRGLGPMVEGSTDALGHEPLADPGDGRGADMECLNEILVVAPRPAWPLVGQEQDACVGEFACGALADGDQMLQRRPLLDRQGHFVLLHLWISFPGVTEARMPIGELNPGYPSIEG